MSAIKSLKLTTLAENLVMAGGLGQWGFSLLLEIEDARGKARKIMLDTARAYNDLMQELRRRIHQARD